MMRYRVLPYRQGSRSAKVLAEALGGRVLKLVGSTFKVKLGDVIINWGQTVPPPDRAVWPVAPLNAPEIIKAASNKLNFFKLMKETGNESIIPPFWTAKGDVPDGAFPVVCRTVLAGHSGDGIVIAADPAALADAALYVGYVKKQEEYRVHVGKTSSGDLQIIAVQRKARRLETPDNEVNWQVRNHKNGFVFVRQNVTPPASILEVSRKALSASGLDFGAVDVIWNAYQEKAYVLEINTAPGLEGQTVEDYVTFFKSLD